VINWLWGVTLASWMHAAAGRFTEAAEELGRASRMHQLTGVSVSAIGGFAQAHEQAYAATRDALGAQEFARHYANGRAAGDYHTLIARTLGEPAPGPGRRDAVRLTPREREIAVLLTQGMTSRDIAKYLQLSHRTVESHLDSIRGKADLKGREDIPPWAKKNLGDDLPSSS
jgi:DNA-binding CsgD family transcriptional regulator